MLLIGLAGFFNVCTDYGEVSEDYTESVAVATPLKEFQLE